MAAINCPYHRMPECDGGCWQCPPHGARDSEEWREYQDKTADDIWAELKEAEAHEQLARTDK